jgi:hypothetical protein
MVQFEAMWLSDAGAGDVGEQVGLVHGPSDLEAPGKDQSKVPCSSACTFCFQWV